MTPLFAKTSKSHTKELKQLGCRPDGPTTFLWLDSIKLAARLCEWSNGSRNFLLLSDGKDQASVMELTELGDVYKTRAVGDLCRHHTWTLMTQ